jgi:hypothetical protein
MPLYTFVCAGCNASREVLTDLATAESLELLCVSCGGSVRKAPVLAVNVIGPAIAAYKAANNAKSEELFKPCGHKYQCRCGIKLTKPNPFKQEIKKAHGFQDD